MKVVLNKMSDSTGKSTSALYLLHGNPNACIFVNSYSTKVSLLALAESLGLKVRKSSIIVMSPNSLRGLTYSHIIIDDTEMFSRQQQDYFIEALPHFSSRLEELTLFGIPNRMMVQANKYNSDLGGTEMAENIISAGDKNYEIQFYSTLGNLSRDAYVVTVSGIKQVRDVHDDGGEYLVVKPVRARVKEGAYFWYISFGGNVKKSQELGYAFSNSVYKQGNYFLTESEAMVAAAKINKIFEDNT